ncbi:MAG TPA: hypothetical protein VGR66_05480 [Candidatus Eisenbacteria bacterium]|nr:hypothetical protein [Candidatus Eisenbacteria bacterium]
MTARSNESHADPWMIRLLLAACLAASGMAGLAGGTRADCPNPAAAGCASVAKPDTFPRIHFRAFPGVIGSQGQDSTVSRKVTLVWDRDLALEQRLIADSSVGGFGGYNIYRVYVSADTCKMELLRRYVYHDTLLWHFPDNVARATFVDPDSAGDIHRVPICRRIDPLNPKRCAQIDSVWALVPPPPPPDGFAAYYAIVYGADPNLIQGGFENEFVPDLAGCSDPSHPETCCNINNLALNLMTEPVIVTGGPSSDLEHVIVVPNPYRGTEAWDSPGTHKLEFRNLPAQAKVQIYTVSGDLVRELSKDTVVSGTAIWDLKNGRAQDVSGGIYMYRVTTPEGFEYKAHFVVVR